MKSIVYILITLIISSIILSAFPKSTIKGQHVFTVQSTENLMKEQLIESANIMATRLTDYGLKDFGMKIDEQNARVEIAFNESDKIQYVTPLLTSKGNTAFYETFDRLDVITNLGIDNELKSILNISLSDVKINGSTGILGYCNEDMKSKVDTYLKDHYVSKPGNGIHFCWSTQADESGNFYLYLLKPKSLLDKSNIMESSVKKGDQSNTPELLLAFDKKGTTIWSEATKRNVGKSIAVVLDDEVLFAPVVQSEITGGRCIFTGNFSIEEMKLFHSLVKNVELPGDFVIGK